MDYDEDKVPEIVLALLFLTRHEEGRAWKGNDWVHVPSAGSSRVLLFVGRRGAEGADKRNE